MKYRINEIIKNYNGNILLQGVQINEYYNILFQLLIIIKSIIYNINHKLKAYIKYINRNK